MGTGRRTWKQVGGFDGKRKERNRTLKVPNKRVACVRAPRSRKVTNSRGIKLLETTPAKTTWTLIKVPISRLFEVYARDVNAFSFDADQLLEFIQRDFEQQTGLERRSQR